MIYLVVGVPASGKSWVCEQLQDRMRYVHHDLYVGMSGPQYVLALASAREQEGSRPVLGEVPFSVREVVEPLVAHGLVVEPVYIIEPPSVLAARYFLREAKSLPDGRIKQEMTYLERARASGAFHGTAAEVLAYLTKRCP